MGIVNLSDVYLPCKDLVVTQKSSFATSDSITILFSNALITELGFLKYKINDDMKFSTVNVKFFVH